MRIFITGATGFVGSAIVSEMLGAGHHVIGLARTDAAAAALRNAGAEAHSGGLDDPDSLRRGAELADGVIHAAFDHDFSRFAESCERDRQAIETIGWALAGTEKRLIVTAGLPLTPGRAVTEEDMPPPAAQGMPRVSEQTAMALSARGIRVSVIRMSQVHDRTKQGFASYLGDHARNTGMSAYVGRGRNRWPAVQRLDAARLYRRVLESGVAGGRYHAVAEEGVHLRSIAEAISRRLNVPVRALPPEAAEAHFGWLNQIAALDMPASSALTQTITGWRPTEVGGIVDDIAP